MFRKGDRVTANTLARRNAWTLDSVRASTLCHDTVVSLFGG